MGIDGFVTFKLIDMDGFATFALTGRDGFVTHPYEFVIVRKGYKPFPTFDCVVGGKPFSTFDCVFRKEQNLFLVVLGRVTNPSLLLVVGKGTKLFNKK
ncbi:hypothetical protein [uncultured Gammaproteobacteria bacterium]|jgi:hypothetical protein|nr:hypothetical protein [uncultured Gammaproteobacteria bacterium]